MPSRRAFIVGSLGGLVGRTAHAAPTPHHVVPPGKGPFPLVVVAHDVTGVDGSVEEACARLARGGRIAVAPALFVRDADTSKIADARVVDDLDAAIAWGKATGRVHGERVSLMGFGWGGRIAWLYGALERAKVKAAVAWNGALSNAQNAFQTKSPLDVAERLRIPVLGLYSERDAFVPLAHVRMMRRELGRSEPSSAPPTLSRLERAQQAALDGKPDVVRRLLAERDEEQNERVDRGRSGVVLYSSFYGAFERATAFLSVNGV